MKHHSDIKKQILFFPFFIVTLIILFSCKKSENIEKHIRDSEVIISNVAEAAASMEVKKNPFSDLSIPTQINKIGDTYFIVDCYHNEVIYNDNLEDPLNEWSVFTDEMLMGHTIAGDGEVYLVDDTENERIMIFEKSDGKYVFSQQFTGITGRPHYIIYDERKKVFYAWCSVSGEMYLLKHGSDNRVYIADIKTIPELVGVYVRSFTIIGDDIYFVSGNSSIIKAKLDTFEITERFPVPSGMAGMVQLTEIDDKFYITVSTDDNWNQDYATIIRCDSLEGLSDGRYEDIYDIFIGGGTPYYITHFDDSYFMTEHRIPGHSIWRFEVRDGVIDAETIM